MALLSDPKERCGVGVHLFAPDFVLLAAIQPFIEVLARGSD